MEGRATLTIVVSMMLMNMAATKTTPTATFWLMRAATAFLSPRLSPLPAHGHPGHPCGYKPR